MPCPDRRIGGQQETLDSSHFSTVQFGFLHCVQSAFLHRVQSEFLHSAIYFSSLCALCNLHFLHAHGAIRFSPRCTLLFFTVQSAFLHSVQSTFLQSHLTLSRRTWMNILFFPFLRILVNINNLMKSIWLLKVWLNPLNNFRVYMFGRIREKGRWWWWCQSWGRG